MPFPSLNTLNFGFAKNKAGGASMPAWNGASRSRSRGVPPRRRLPLPQGNKTTDDNEHDDVEAIKERFRAAGAARRTIEAEWVLNGLCFEGRAYYKWDEGTHRAQDLRVDGEHSRYVWHNLTRPLVNKVAGLATMTQPDGNFIPDTDAEIDVLAAEEARCAAADILRYNGGRQKITLASVISSIVYGIAWEMPYWAASAKADIPKFGEKGEIVGKTSAPVGMVKIDTLSPFQVFIDPSASQWDKARWVIVAATVTLDELRERFGDAATEGVRADTRDASGGYLENYLPGANVGDTGYGGFGASGTSDVQNQAVLTLNYYQKAGDDCPLDDAIADIDREDGNDLAGYENEYGDRDDEPRRGRGSRGTSGKPAYPNGRYVVIAGDRRIYDGDLPFGNGELPLARVVYQEALHHPYGNGLVGDLRPVQMEYNRMRTKLVCQTEDAKNTLLVPFTAEIGVDAYEPEEHRTWRRVHWDNTEGGPPMWQGAPPVTADVYNIMGSAWENMQHIAGVHDVNMGGTPTGVTAGISIELLQQGDKTQIGLFTGNLEQLASDRDTLIIQCFSANASGSLPRLVGVDDTGDARTAKKRAMSFKALTGGGSVRVHVEPGSATPKSPAGQKQELLDLINMHLLDPANPQALPGLLALGKTQADPMVRRLIAGMQALQDQQAAQQQAQMASGQAGAGPSSPASPSPSASPSPLPGPLPPPRPLPRPNERGGV